MKLVYSLNYASRAKTTWISICTFSLLAIRTLFNKASLATSHLFQRSVLFSDSQECEDH